MSEEVSYPPIKTGKYTFNYIDLYEVAKKELLLHSINIYGDTGEGKSYITNTILDAISSYINILHIFCPTAKVDKSFPMVKYTSPAFVHETLDMERISSIIKRSSQNCEMYNSIAKPEVMSDATKKFILKLYASNNEDKLYADTAKKYKRIKQIDRRFDYENATIDERLEHDLFIVKLYKPIMYKCKKYLRDKKISIPSEYHEYSLPVMFYDLKPCDVILTNDCGDIIDNLKKNDLQVMTSLVMKERHFGITTIHLLQDVRYIQKSDRGQVKVNVFVSPGAITSYISTLTIKGDLKNRLEAASEHILVADRSAAKRRYPVVIYMKIPNIIGYTYADSRLELEQKGNVRLYKKIEEKDILADPSASNPLMNMFSKKH